MFMRPLLVHYVGCGVRPRIGSMAAAAAEQDGEIMSDAFDPYYSWLGIPPQEQPVDYYRLLGIVLYEDNPEVIENAADRQMAHLHTQQLSKHAALSQRLLNEVAAAKVCLANPKKKAAYDEQLRKMGKKPLVHRRTPSHGSVPTPIPISPAAERPVGNRPKPVEIKVESPESLRQQRARFREKRSLITAGLLLISAALVLAFLWSFLSNRDLTARSPENDADRAAGRPADQQPEEPGNEPSEQVPGQSEPANVPPVEPPQTSEDDSQTNRQEPPDDSKQPGDRETGPDHPPSTPADLPVVTEKARHPVPSGEAQRKILSQIDEIYELDRERTIPQRLQIAKELLAIGKRSRDDMDERFVVLRKAMELAGEAGDATLMFEAIDVIAVDHEIDELTVKANTLVSFAAKQNAAAGVGSFVRGIRTVIGRAVAAECYDVALKLADAAVQLAERPGGTNFRKEAHDRQTRLRQLGERHRLFQQAQATIESSPDDAGAHLEIGCWYRFAKSDWDRGLPHLAKGNDPRLLTLSSLELAPRSGDANDLAKLADAWWDLAEESGGEHHDAMMLRAGFWYKAAEAAGLVSLTRIKAKKRLAQIAEIRSPAEQPPGKTTAALPAPNPPASASLNEAWRQINRGNVKAARVVLDAVIKKNSGDIRAGFSLGLLDALSAHEWQSAEKHFTKCIRLQPTHVPSLNNLALVNIRLKETTAAMRNWRTALEASPRPPTEILHNLARFQYLIKNKRIGLTATASKSLDRLSEMAAAGGGSLPSVGSSTGWSYMRLPASDGPGLGWSSSTRYVDHCCITCNGRGTVNCPNRGCSRGTVRSYRMEMVGTNPVTGAKMMRKVAIRVPCGTCGGRGGVACQSCSGSRSRSGGR